MGICLLVVNDDLICRNVVSQVLKCCTYEELHIGRLMDALNAIWEKRDIINLVLTNVQRLGEKGSEILNQIRNQFNFEIIYMTPDDKKVEWKGESSVAAYVVHVSTIGDMNNLWESALAKEKAANQEGTSAQMASKGHDYVSEASREKTPSVGDGSGTHQKRKRKLEPGDYHPVEKKPRVVWTREMHKKFLEAIEILGPDKTFPKKIVELMNEPGLTREQVASHLQKYRICLKRNQEAANSHSGINPWLPSFNSALSINSLQRFSHVKSQPHGLPFQQGPYRTISMPALGLPRPFTVPQLSTSISNMSPADLPAGSDQGIQQQLCTPNLSSSQAISQNNNFVHFANPQCSDLGGGPMQMQSKYFTRRPMNGSFRIYGDQTKNMLLSTERGSTSSTNAAMPSNSQTFHNFIGLRFTSDGRSLKFGQTGVSGGSEIKTDVFSSVGTTESLDHSNPLTSASYTPEPPNTLPQSGSHQDEVSDYSPSLFSDCTFEQEPFLSLLDSSIEGNLTHCPSLPVDWTSQQNHPLPCTSGNPEQSHSHSTPGKPIPRQQSSPSFLEAPMNWNTSHTLPENFFSQPELSIPPLCIPGNVTTVQYPPVPPSGASIDEITVHSSLIFTPQQEISFPSSGTSVNGTSGQEPSTSTYQIPQQESSIPRMPSIQHELDNFRPEEDINVFLNEMGCSSPELFWEGFFDDTDTLLNHVN